MSALDDCISGHGVVSHAARAELAALRSEVERLRGALGKIADWKLKSDTCSDVLMQNIALAALATDPTREPRVDSGMADTRPRGSTDPKSEPTPAEGLPPEAPTIHPPAECPECGGHGEVAMAGILREECGSCHGTGRAPSPRKTEEQR